MHLGGRRIGHIRVEHFLGQGGMGDVYEGFDEKLRRRVALKVLHRHPGDRDARARLIREAHALSQLEHQNICRIYDLIDDEPDVDVLVLELIDGRTLTQAIREGLTGAEHLRIATSIADVLVAAHRAGIIHRDLKPDNVMLTRQGVVKVLDFGLARWLERSSGKHEAVRIHPREQSEHGFISDAKQTQKTWIRPGMMETPAVATAVGIAVGTPLYMSPEQARGETLTTASDMYAFGLLLQTLFTGNEPYPQGWSGAEVMMKAAIGQSLPVTGKQREIVALINQLKQLAPSDRPTAVDALTKLKFIVERPKRLVRNAAAAAAIALTVLGTTKYTLDLRHERAVAKAAENEARKRRAQADDLIGFMVGDLRKKLEPVGRLDVLDATATKALQYVASLDPRALSVPELTRTAEALNQLGEVRIAQGRVPDAIHAYERSLALTREAVRRAPADNNAQFANGQSEFGAGNSLRLYGNLPEALRHMRAYMSIGELLAGRGPGVEKYQLERAYGHSAVASVLELQGDLKGALEHLRVTVEVKRAIAMAAPDDSGRQLDYAGTLNRLGFDMQRDGRLEEARLNFDGEQEIMARLVARDPLQMVWRQQQAISHSYAATIAELMGDDAAGLEHRNAELAIEDELHRRDPANADWARNLAMTYMHVGDARRRAGDPRKALASIAEAEKLMRAVLIIDPKRKSWQRDYAVLETTRARAELAAGNRQAALNAADAAMRLLEPLTDRGSVRYIADGRLVRGDALAAVGRGAAAREEWSKGRTVIEPIARTATDPQLIDIWCRTLIRLGEDSQARSLLQRLAVIGYRSRDLLDVAKEGKESRVAAEGG